MPVDARQLKELFNEACAMPPAARAAWLERQCGGDAELRQRVEALLIAHDASGGILQEQVPPEKIDPFATIPEESSPVPPPLPTTMDHHQASAPETVIAGRYTLVEKIGEGGMGEVWVAKQAEPVKRKVALKLIKAGMDSNSVLARFEQERQALAMMDHPSIAKVLDGGLTEARKPFFVMELVNGLPLSKFCDEAKLGIRERLELFVPICQAVQHAHQKGIVHRDLKPSNILVTLYDGRPVPKVIDFGIAKATGGKLIDESLSTEFGAIVGTFEYMAPEQTGFSALDVDTRADLYSLGVILYELLTGLRPFDSKRLKQAALNEMVRIIREEEPPRPSTRLSSNESSPSLAAVRQMEPRKLMALLRGELDWIVMRCLEKDRGRRYETANGLGRDVQRFLANEPVEACPPSAGYKLRKFVRRNKGPVLAASLVLLTLVVGIIGTTLGMVRAQKRLLQIEKGTEMLGSILSDLNPDNEVAEGKSLRAILGDRAESAAAQLDSESIGDALTVAKLQNILGQSLIGLGRHSTAVLLLQKAATTRAANLGDDHLDTLLSRHNLAVAYEEDGQFDSAILLAKGTLKTAEAKLEDDHPLTLKIRNNLAVAYLSADKLDLAIPLFEGILKAREASRGEDHPDSLTSRDNLAGAYRVSGKHNQAIALFELTLKARKVTRGKDHPQTLVSSHHLASAYLDAGKLKSAIDLLEPTLKAQETRLGYDHPRTLDTCNSLACAYQSDGKLELAIPLFERTLEAQKSKLGDNHRDTLITSANLAVAYRLNGDLDLAISLFERTLKAQKILLGDNHRHTLKTSADLAVAYSVKGDLALAIPLLIRTLKAQGTKLGNEHRDTLETSNRLACAYWRAQKLDEAIQLFEKLVPLAQKQLGQGHPVTIEYTINLITALEVSHQYAKAVNAGAELLLVLRKQVSAAESDLADTLAPVGLSLLKLDKPASAETVLRECLAIRLKKEPDKWTTSNTQSALGGALLGQTKYVDAEPLLMQGYEGMKQHEAKIPPQSKIRLTEALERLVQLCDATDKIDEAAKWRKELEAARAVKNK